MGYDYGGGGGGGDYGGSYGGGDYRGYGGGGGDYHYVGGERGDRGYTGTDTGPDTSGIGPDTSGIGPDTSSIGPDTSSIGPDTSSISYPGGGAGGLTDARAGFGDVGFGDVGGGAGGGFGGPGGGDQIGGVGGTDVSGVGGGSYPGGGGGFADFARNYAGGGANIYAADARMRGFDLGGGPGADLGLGVGAADLGTPGGVASGAGLGTAFGPGAAGASSAGGAGAISAPSAGDALSVLGGDILSQHQDSPLAAFDVSAATEIAGAMPPGVGTPEAEAAATGQQGAPPPDITNVAVHLLDEVPADQQAPADIVPSTTTTVEPTLDTGNVTPPSLTGADATTATSAQSQAVPGYDFGTSGWFNPQSAELANARQAAFGTTNQTNMDRLANSLMSEVGLRTGFGSASANAIQAETEADLNRSLSRDMPLGSTLTSTYNPRTDTGYFPSSTTSRLGLPVSDLDAAKTQAAFDAAMQGSDVSKLATGNASLRTGVGEPTFAARGATGMERFGIEKPDRAWAAAMRDVGTPNTKTMAGDVASSGGDLTDFAGLGKAPPGAAPPSGDTLTAEDINAAPFLGPFGPEAFPTDPEQRAVLAQNTADRAAARAAAGQNYPDYASAGGDTASAFAGFPSGGLPGIPVPRPDVSAPEVFNAGLPGARFLPGAEFSDLDPLTQMRALEGTNPYTDAPFATSLGFPGERPPETAAPNPRGEPMGPLTSWADLLFNNPNATVAPPAWDEPGAPPIAAPGELPGVAAREAPTPVKTTSIDNPLAGQYQRMVWMADPTLAAAMPAFPGTAAAPEAPPPALPMPIPAPPEAAPPPSPSPPGMAVPGPSAPAQAPVELATALPAAGGGGDQFREAIPRGGVERGPPAYTPTPGGLGGALMNAAAPGSITAAAQQPGAAAPQQVTPQQQQVNALVNNLTQQWYQVLLNQGMNPNDPQTQALVAAQVQAQINGMLQQQQRRAA